MKPEIHIKQSNASELKKFEKGGRRVCLKFETTQVLFLYRIITRDENSERMAHYANEIIKINIKNSFEKFLRQIFIFTISKIYRFFFFKRQFRFNDTKYNIFKSTFIQKKVAIFIVCSMIGDA